MPGSFQISGRFGDCCSCTRLTFVGIWLHKQVALNCCAARVRAEDDNVCAELLLVWFREPAWSPHIGVPVGEASLPGLPDP